MAKLWAGITAGALAGAAGATAMNATTYIDQTIRGDAGTSSPAGPHVADTAASIVDVDRNRAAALGPLGGLGVGVGIGAVAGALRGASATPPRAVAAVVTGLAAMLVSDGIALSTGSARSDWRRPVTLLRDLVPHLAYGAVTGLALHRMLDPHTTDISR